jgi:hypothetical protein
MGVLQVQSGDGRCDVQQPVDSVYCHSAGGVLGDAGGAIGCPDGDDALDTWLNPDDARCADVLLGGDADQREGQAVQGMGRVNDPNRVCG